MFYIWWFFFLPRDLPICSLWFHKPPSAAQMVQACGAWPVDHIDQLVWQAIDRKGTIVRAGSANTILDLSQIIAWDAYKIEIVWPAFKATTSCSIKISHSGMPTIAEAEEQCPDQSGPWLAGQRTLELAGSLPEDIQAGQICRMPQLRKGSGLLDLPEKPSELATTKPYELLAGALLWHGLAEPRCGGYSGLRTSWPSAATTCGLESAMPNVIEWQNLYDPSIYEAGAAAGVPPRLIKAMIAQESQFWPGWINQAGETGLLQVTEQGADIALRYSPDLYNQFCHGSDCSAGYDLLPDYRQAELWRALLKPDRSMLTNARIVAAYYCYANEIDPRPDPAGRWDVTLAVWNAGAGCIRLGEICPQGQRYIDEVAK
jgi:hypothetical protein